MPPFTQDRFIVEERGPDDACGPAQTRWISEPGCSTQFGANVEILHPGSRSSLKHWHAAEDEMVYVLEGEVTLVEGDGETLLRPGDAATFRAGVAVRHYLHTRSAGSTRCLIVGTRAPIDTISYPDHDRVCQRDRSLPDDILTDGRGSLASNPYR